MGEPTLTDRDEKIVCKVCRGDGFVVEIQATHGCDGTDENCAMICPVPEQVQVGCKDCCGEGYVK